MLLRLHEPRTWPAGGQSRTRTFAGLQPGAPYSSYRLYINAAEDLVHCGGYLRARDRLRPSTTTAAGACLCAWKAKSLSAATRFLTTLSGRPIETEVVRNGPGEVSVAAPARNAFHQVECLGDVPATSLHIYGANIKGVYPAQSLG